MRQSGAVRLHAQVPRLRCSPAVRAGTQLSAAHPRHASPRAAGSTDASTQQRLDRRSALAVPLLLGPLLSLWPTATPAAAAAAAAPAAGFNPTPMTALKGKDYGKSRMRFPDYELSASGLEYHDFKVGTGALPKDGDLVVVDWAGYTIGYYGRPFEARNKSKGGSFTGENKDFLRFKLGANAMIPGFEEAIRGMKTGGIRRVVVDPELGYPEDEYKTVGPKPSNFSGERALSFVLGNRGMIDKTLMFDIELIRINP